LRNVGKALVTDTESQKRQCDIVLDGRFNKSHAHYRSCFPVIDFKVMWCGNAELHSPVQYCRR